MRILILTGLQEELLPFLERRAFQFDRARGAYRSLQHPDLLAATTGPGVKKARELRKLLRSFVPHVIVNAGWLDCCAKPMNARRGIGCASVA